jgi:hypothetical protein
MKLQKLLCTIPVPYDPDTVPVRQLIQNLFNFFYLTNYSFSDFTVCQFLHIYLQDVTSKLKAENLELCQDARAAKAYR